MVAFNKRFPDIDTSAAAASCVDSESEMYVVPDTELWEIFQKKQLRKLRNSDGSIGFLHVN